ncbi:UDP-galactose transporter senju [Anthonomus grandis grandis]|uniref:UDP-galactose transporter senju n=1 Tax=Anthonomus grandis grandis TaxID=2921223 RepID=UPI0021653F9A|nr:UDP-galactose transporter senju [Anthonomus grandis grandis]
MTRISWRELFPSKFSFIIFVVYILLFVNQGILVTASQQSNNKYDYNIVTVVLCTEFLKLLLSCILYCRENSPANLLGEVVSNKKVLVLYFLPAFLYCLYNNLAFLNLSTFDPTTYYLLLQLRVVVTGILFQLIFGKLLSRKQWLSLIILTIGCMLKQIPMGQEETAHTTSDSTDTQKSQSLNLSNAVFIIVQIFCSCFAGVYNEYLLKNQGSNVNIFVQNIFMYLDSIICNLIVLIINGSIATAFQYDNVIKIMHYKVLLVMFNNATVGIVTSFFLKTLNSILKTFASAMELALTAVFSLILFAIPIHLNTALAIATVLYAIYLYSQNPINNVTKHEEKTIQEENEELLQMEEV